MSVQVRDGHDRCQVAFDNEEDAEREAMKDRASDLTEDERELRRPLLNAHERGAQLGKECCPETNLFAIVPSTGVLASGRTSSRAIYRPARRRS